MSIFKKKLIALFLTLAMLFSILPLDVGGLAPKPAYAAGTRVDWNGGNKGNITVSVDTDFYLASGTTTTVGTITVSNDAKITFNGEGTANITSIASANATGYITVPPTSGSNGLNGVAVSSNVNTAPGNGTAGLNFSGTTGGTGGNGGSGGSALGNTMPPVTGGTGGDGGKGGTGQSQNGKKASNVDVTVNGGVISVGTVSSGDGSAGGTGGIGGNGGNGGHGGFLGRTEGFNDSYHGKPGNGGNGGDGGNANGGDGGNIRVVINNGSLTISNVVLGKGASSGVGGRGGVGGLGRETGAGAWSYGGYGGNGGNAISGSSGDFFLEQTNGSLRINSVLTPVPDISGTSGYWGNGGSSEHGGIQQSNGNRGSCNGGDGSNVTYALHGGKSVIPDVIAGSGGPRTNVDYGNSLSGRGGNVVFSMIGDVTSVASKSFKAGGSPGLSVNEYYGSVSISLKKLSGYVNLGDIEGRDVNLQYEGVNTKDNLNVPSVKINSQNKFKTSVSNGLLTSPVSPHVSNVSGSGVSAVGINGSGSGLLDLSFASGKESSRVIKVVDAVTEEILYSGSPGSNVTHIFLSTAESKGIKILRDSHIVINPVTNSGIFSAANVSQVISVEDALILNLKFNPNGGELNSIPKQSLFLNAKGYEPDEPTRGGYAFVGWYKNPEGSGTAWNFSTDLVTSNTELYAKWQPGPPSITKLEMSPKSWTKDKVKLTVTAGGNGELKYSFNAGMNWQSNNFTEFSKNTSLAANAIQIKDNHGNVTMYPSAVAIDNIDTTAPNIVTVSKSNEGKVQSVDLMINAFDLQSGVKDYSFDAGVNWQAANYKAYTENCTIPASSIWVRDTAGNVVKYPSPVVISNIADLVKPVISRVDIAPNTWTKENIEATITATDNIAITGYSFDAGATWQTENSMIFSKNTTLLANDIQVKDSGGNITKWPTAVVIDKIDRTAPTAPTIALASTDPNAKTRAATNYTVTATITPGVDSGSGIAKTQFQVKPDGSVVNGDWLDYTAPHVISTTGKYIIYTRCIDNAGNISEVTSKTTSLDNNQPDKPVIPPPSGGGTGNGDVDITVPVVPGFDYFYQIIPADSPIIDSAWKPLVGDKVTVTAEGKWDIYIKASNGLTDVISDKVTVTIDKTAPAISEVQIKPNSWTNSTVSIEILATDALTGIKAYSFDNGVTWQDSNAKTYDSNATLAIDMIQVKDVSGNIAKYGSLIVIDKIDKVIPTAPILSAEVTKNFITIDITAGYDVGSGVAKTQYQVQAESIDALDSAWQDFSIKQAITVDGRYSIYARTVDKAGNTSQVIQKDIVLDNNPPEKPILPPLDGGEINDGDTDITVPVVPGFDYFYQIIPADSALTDTWNPLVGDKVTVTAEGTWDVYVKVTNGITEAISDAMRVVIDKTAPDISEAQIKPNAWTNSTVSIEVLATDALTGIKSFSFDAGATWQDSNTKTFDSNTTLAIDMIQVKDVADNIAKYGSPIVIDKIDKVAPTAPTIAVVSTDPTVKARASTAYEVSVEVTPGTDGDSGVAKTQYQIKKQGLEAIDTDWLEYTDKVVIKENGQFTIYARCLDAAGNISALTKENASLDNNKPDKPIIPTPPPGTDGEITIPILPGMTYSYQVVAADVAMTTTWLPLPVDGKITVSEEGIWDAYIKISNGLTETISDPIRIVVDKTAPLVPSISITSTDPTAKARASTDYKLTVEITPGSDSGSGVAKTQYQVKPVGQIAVDADWLDYTAAVNITDSGKHMVYARCLDAAGNISAIAEKSASLDNNKPDKPIIPPPSGGGTGNGDVDITVPVVPGFDYFYQVVAADSALTNTWNPLVGDKFTVTEEGKWDVYIKSTNGITESVSDPIRIVIDKTAPAISEVTVASGLVTVIASDILTSINGYSFDAGSTWQESNAKTFDENTSLAADAVQVKDVAGNIAKYPDAIEITGFDDTKNPVIESVTTSDMVNNVIAVSINATDESGIKEYSFDGGISWRVNNWKNYDVNQIIPAGTLQAKDHAGNIAVYSTELRITEIPLFAPPKTDIASNEDIVVPFEMDQVLTYAYQVTDYKVTTPSPSAWVTVAANEQVVITDEGFWHTFVKVDDFIGHEAVSDPFKILLDKTPPTAPAIDVNLKESKVLVSDGTDALSGIKETKILVNGQSIETAPLKIANAKTRSTYSAKTYEIALKPGQYTIEAQTADNVGNVSNSTTQTVEIKEGASNGGGGGGSSSSGGSGSSSKPQGPGQNNSGGKDKDGKAFVLKNKVTVNKVTLANGYVAGYKDGSFKPLAPISRSEFASMLNRLIVTEQPKKMAFYSDLKPTNWAYKDIQALQNLKIMNVYGVDFKGDQPITREEVAFALTNLLDLSNYSASSEFSDIARSPYKDQIAKAYNAGITQGQGTKATFNPSATITRAEAVAMINRVFGVTSNASEQKKNQFNDIFATDWFYKDVVNASIK